MGIHRFYPWFKTNFGKHLKDVKMPSDSSATQVDNFMIDLNGIFHTSCQRIYKYGNFKQSKRLISSTSLSLKNRDIDVFKDVCFEIERLLKFIIPKKRLILAVDGVAPICKQTQQRQRRFKSAHEQVNSNSNEQEFDSCMISPGTLFMHNLTCYIENFIKQKIISDQLWSNIEIIFSNEKVPSEGEQKCLQFVRHNKVKNPEENYCIHGMDADLIMLALSSHSPFYILRENIYESGFHLIDISGVALDLVKLMDWGANNDTNKKFISDRAIDDFVFLCFVVGNDFLPHIPSIEIAEGGIDIMLEVYRKVGLDYGHLTRIHNNNILFVKKSLEIFFYELSTYEKGMFEDKINSNTVFFPHPIIDRNTFFDKDTGFKLINYEKFSEDYYITNFGTTDIKSICLEYLEGMQWVITYYNKKVPCWNWCYKYNYAPLAKDLAKYVKDFRFKDYSLNSSSPNEPFQQLLSIMSPKSSYLIPSPLKELMLLDTSPLKEYYPETFEIDIAGKRKAWEGKAILPIINQERLSIAYKSYISKVDPSLNFLNISKKPVKYVNGNIIEFEL